MIPWFYLTSPLTPTSQHQKKKNGGNQKRRRQKLPNKNWSPLKLVVNMAPMTKNVKSVFWARETSNSILPSEQWRLEGGINVCIIIYFRGFEALSRIQKWVLGIDLSGAKNNATRSFRTHFEVFKKKWAKHCLKESKRKRLPSKQRLAAECSIKSCPKPGDKTEGGELLRQINTPADAIGKREI